ncbi:MAG: hypothetical protein ACKOPG_05545 [Novosphingobium sp.]
MKRRWKIMLGVMGLSMFLLLADHKSHESACAKTSSADALSHALEQKQGMLSRSIPSFRDNFDNNDGRVVGHTDEGSTLVEFKRKDGKTLTARIDEDCYVGWSLPD